MKLIASLLVALVAVQASVVPTDQPDLGAAIKNFLHKIKQSMPCGLEEGQSLSPYIMQKDDGKYHTVQYNAPDIQ